MIAPLWFASPPEVHSTLLTAGAGAGPLLAAAEAWRGLAAEYAETAAELDALLAAVQAAAWQGSSAQRFVAAHQPYLYWLGEASKVAATAATGHETVAAGYAAALASMPTPGELVANHVLHGVLVATNFFGINTIPIALNEGDYLRMWIQAATTMAAYHAVAGESIASISATSPAPRIVTAEASPVEDSVSGDPTELIIEALQNILTRIGDLAAQYLPGPVGSAVSQMLDSVVAFMSTQLFLIPFYSIVDPAIYFGPFMPLLLPFLAPIGLVGLVGLAEAVTPEDLPPAVQGATSQPGNPIMAAPGQPTLAGTGTTAAAPSAGAPATSVPASAPPASGSVAQLFYAIGGGPDGEGFSPTSGTTRRAAVAAGAVAPSAKMPADSRQLRAKRKAGLRQRVHKYQFAYLGADIPSLVPDDPTPAEGIFASVSGAGPLGFAGTSPKPVAAEAKGLTRLGGSELDDAPREPMLPHTWDGDSA
ncbi:PPE family protein [Mycobacterium conspicuum]|jgi:PPE-repeat protein|uniref:Putative PPE family protein PPE37 n=1 Tax=Mycobacterium conspicuum TaxID=44010 RepID=A0A1X1TDL8_9MYCO|nr:PPE family protein [Mycobacterium conspicuum]ORV42661.1 hypothetical protein AWC00_10925 [Mycobacterium conspicuum]BBZ41983.1 putative PPE family protein PPE37 [Mycobacterium conspicuum]